MLKYFIVLISLLPFSVFSQTNFKSQQKTYERVRTAYSEKESFLIKYADSLGYKNLQNNILIIAYKQEQLLEIWSKDVDSSAYSLFITYNFAGFSGDLGPKRKEGDLQIPEGFYTINSFNPASSFYLSLKVSYPNISDKILSNKSKPGGDIYIHGNTCTIGCIPITDDKIKELYILAVEAKNAGQSNIPVYIFPAKLTDNNFYNLRQQYAENKELLLFWENLKIGYDLFQKNQTELEFDVDKSGIYIFK